jgi:hypothetical protein
MRPITEFLSDIEDDVVFHVLPEGVAWASPGAARLLGVALQDLIGTHLSAYIEPRDLAHVEQSTRLEVLAGKTVENLAIHVRVSDGSYKSVRARLRPLRDSDGRITGAIVGWRETGETGSAAARAFATLAEGTRVLLRSTTEKDLLEQMCEAVCRTSGYTFAWYGQRIDDPQRSVRLLAVGGDDRGYTDSLQVTWGDGPTAQGPTGRALRTGRTQVVNDLATDPNFAPWRSAAMERGVECSVALPVWCDSEIHGAFMVYASQPNIFDEQAR